MVTELKYRVDVEALEHLAAKALHRNEIAFVNVATVDPISFDPYEENRITGGFILIERHTNATVAAGHGDADDLSRTISRRGARNSKRGKLDRANDNLIAANIEVR